MKTTTIILSAAILAGCANTGAQYQPLVDSRTQGANYSQDLAECQAYATQRAGAADGAVAGAVFGALLGAAAGEGTQRDIIKRCLAGRGYRIARIYGVFGASKTTPAPTALSPAASAAHASPSMGGSWMGLPVVRLVPDSQSR